jgi:hypothetical protein
MAVGLAVPLAVGLAVMSSALAVALAVALASSSLCCFATAAGARTNAATRATAVNNSNLLNGTSFGLLPFGAYLHPPFQQHACWQSCTTASTSQHQNEGCKVPPILNYRSRLPARLTSDLLRHPMIVRNLILFSPFQTCCAPLSTGLCGVGLLMGNAIGHPCDPGMR